MLYVPSPKRPPEVGAPPLSVQLLKAVVQVPWHAPGKVALPPEPMQLPAACLPGLHASASASPGTASRSSRGGSWAPLCRSRSVTFPPSRRRPPSCTDTPATVRDRAPDPQRRQPSPVCVARIPPSCLCTSVAVDVPMNGPQQAAPAGRRGSRRPPARDARARGRDASLITCMRASSPEVARESVARLGPLRFDDV